MAGVSGPGIANNEDQDRLRRLGCGILWGRTCTFGKRRALTAGYYDKLHEAQGIQRRFSNTVYPLEGRQFQHDVLYMDSHDRNNMAWDGVETFRLIVP